MTKALIIGDFALYRDVLSLPMTFFPKGGKPFILPDEAALKANFDLYVAIIRLHGVTDIYRQVLGYDQIGPDDVRLRILTHILVRANLLAEPFAMQMLLQRRDGL